jgi:hypothetical protein
MGSVSPRGYIKVEKRDRETCIIIQYQKCSEYYKLTAKRVNLSLELKYSEITRPLKKMAQ